MRSGDTTANCRGEIGRAAVTNAENIYDYAGQDPINGCDLDGRVCQIKGVSPVVYFAN
jgi:hypothetical protein